MTRHARLQAMFNGAVAAFQGGDLAGARRQCEAMLAIDRHCPPALQMLGAIAMRQGDARRAVGHFAALAKAQPAVAQAHADLGIACFEAGDMKAAETAFRAAVARDGRHAQAWYGLGRSLADPAAAAEALARAVALQPDFAEAQAELGRLSLLLGRTREALAALGAAVALRPGLAEAHTNLGIAEDKAGNLRQALAHHRRAIAIRPAFAKAHNNLASVCLRLGLLEDAADAAEAATRRDPGYAKAFANLGDALGRMGMAEAAIAALARAVALEPLHTEAQANLLRQRQIVCDWRDAGNDAAIAAALVERGDGLFPPFFLLGFDSTPAQHLACARARVATMTPEPLPPLPPRTGPGRIRVGYLSADYRRHPVAFLAAGLFEVHDRAGFEFIGYSIGPDDGSDLRARIAAAFDGFADLGACTDREAAERIRADGIDILVDLNGHTEFARSAIAGHRPAPVQVNFLGYPGTMAADFIDYVIADPFVVPPGQEIHFSERVVRLPHCYQPNDSTRPIAETPARGDCGLPEEAFVFCCFNNTYKLTAPVFSIWMRLLDAVPGSVLWLLSAAPAMEANLRREAAARGVAPERLVFAPKIDQARHLARHRCADLFLDTLPYNAHTTASDALWAGLPVLTRAGASFPSRVAGSLLSAVGLPDLITSDAGEYEAAALALARDPARLAEVKARLAANLRTAPLFDTRRFARDLETAYRRMWDLAVSGQAPQAFDL
jgi:predicted O-linked N-acetylglucosamine transferase (SPINDLY family)